MAFDSSLYDYDAGYYMYQFPEGSFWLPGKMVLNGRATWSRRAVDAAINADLDDSDILVATYPKTGLCCMAFLHLKCNLHFDIITNGLNFQTRVKKNVTKIVTTKCHCNLSQQTTTTSLDKISCICYVFIYSLRGILCR